MKSRPFVNTYKIPPRFCVICRKFSVNTHLLDIFVMRIYNVSVKKAFNSKKRRYCYEKNTKKIVSMNMIKITKNSEHDYDKNN